MNTVYRHSLLTTPQSPVTPSPSPPCGFWNQTPEQIAKRLCGQRCFVREPRIIKPQCDRVADVMVRRNDTVVLPPSRFWGLWSGEASSKGCQRCRGENWFVGRASQVSRSESSCMLPSGANLKPWFRPSHLIINNHAPGWVDPSTSIWRKAFFPPTSGPRFVHQAGPARSSTLVAVIILPAVDLYPLHPSSSPVLDAYALDPSTMLPTTLMTFLLWVKRCIQTRDWSLMVR